MSCSELIAKVVQDLEDAGHCARQSVDPVFEADPWARDANIYVSLASTINETCAAALSEVDREACSGRSADSILESVQSPLLSNCPHSEYIASKTSMWPRICQS